MWSKRVPKENAFLILENYQVLKTIKQDYTQIIQIILE